MHGCCLDSQNRFPVATESSFLSDSNEKSFILQIAQEYVDKIENQAWHTLLSEQILDTKAEFQRHDHDTGSSEVQIAILTKEIEALTAHLKANKKDHSSRYGLLRKVQNRRSLLDYLKRENEASYKELIKKLGIRR